MSSRTCKTGPLPQVGTANPERVQEAKTQAWLTNKKVAILAQRVAPTRLDQFQILSRHHQFDQAWNDYANYQYENHRLKADQQHLQRSAKRIR